MTASKVLSGSLSNYLRLIIQIGVQLWTTPLIINGVGKDVYGIWALVFSILSIVGILEFGVGAGAVKYAAEHRGSGDAVRRNKGLSTLLVLSWICSAIAILVLVVGIAAGPSLMGVAPNLVGTVRWVFLLLGLRYTVLLWPLSLFQGVLFGQARIGTINVIQIASNLVYGFGCWLSIHQGSGIVGVAAWNLGTMAVEYGSYWWLARRTNPDLELKPSDFDKQTLQDSSKLALSQLIVTASGLILLRTDPLIIQAFLSLSAVSTYAVALRVSESAFMLVKQFINVLSPHIAALYGKGDMEGVRRLFLVSSRYALVPAVAVATPFVIYGGDILRLWIGPSVSDGGPVLSVLCLGMALMTPQVVASSFLTYTGRYLHTSRPIIAGAILNVIASSVFVKLFGVVGAALGTLVAIVIADVFWILSIALREMGLKPVAYLKEAVLPVVPGALVYTGAMFIAHQVVPPHSLVSIGSVVGLSMLLFLGTFAVTGLRPHDRTRFTCRLVRRPA